jgi:molecular chaperone DnaJ
MTVPRDYYEVLGVPRDADTKTIKEAFRQLARRYHPDISAEPDAEQRFKEVAEAYGMLSDPARRASYDAQGSAGLAGATSEDLWGGIDFADVFGSGAAAFGSLFERLFGPTAAGPQRSQDVHLDLVIALDEVLTGGNHAVTIRRPGPCLRCAGSGSRPGTTPRRCPGCGGTGQRAVASRHGPLVVHQVTTCPECGGGGRVIDQPCPACEASGTAVCEEKVTFGIPPGIPEGATLRLTGRGLPSPVPGGLPGDAYVSIRTRADPRFTRADADLWHNLHVQAPDAVLGVTTAVPVPGGEARVRVPPGTQPGSVLRVGGKGLPRYGGHGRGSLNLTVILDIPRQLSSRQRQLYEQLRAEDAGIRSTAGGSPEPDAPRSGGKITADAGGRHAEGRGLLIFASVLLLVTGVVNLVGGIVAISGSQIFIASAHSVYGGLRAWGWVMAIFGAVQLLVAAGVWAGSQLARWLAVAAVGLNAIGQMFFIPANPLWSVLIIAMEVVVLWGLCAYGSRENLPTRTTGRRSPR